MQRCQQGEITESNLEDLVAGLAPVDFDPQQLHRYQRRKTHVYLKDFSASMQKAMS